MPINEIITLKSFLAHTGALQVRLLLQAISHTAQPQAKTQYQTVISLTVHPEASYPLYSVFWGLSEHSPFSHNLGGPQRPPI